MIRLSRRVWSPCAGRRVCDRDRGGRRRLYRRSRVDRRRGLALDAPARGPAAAHDPKDRRPAMTADAKRPLVVIGTSGSHDYLKDGTGDRRYWLLGDPAPGPAAPLSPPERAPPPP